MVPEAIVDTRDLTKRYGKHSAVESLNLQVHEGEIFGFLGPNGSGKTTTLLMLLGLTQPTSGWARVCGLDPSRDGVKVKEKVGFLPENLGFYQDMTAWENLDYVAQLNGIPASVADEKIPQVLETVGLREEADKRLSAFSRGMCQRLGIAEILVRSPQLVFLDEPTLGLDPEGADRIVRFIRSLSREQKMTVVLSSHDLKQVQKICDRVGIMLNGKMIACGAIEELAGATQVAEKGKLSLDEIYLRYFQEDAP